MSDVGMLWARSSMAEHSAYIRQVVGSSPTGPTKYARLAHLAERFFDVEKVAGSNPASRTT